MRKLGHKIYGPGSIASFVLGLIGFLMVVYPIVAGVLGVYGLLNMFLIIPITGAALGLLAIVYYSRAKKYLKRRSIARGIGFARIGLITGIIALIIGSAISGAFVYIYYESKDSPNEPIGSVQLYFYGDEEYREVATETLLLPDNTLLTIGTRRNYKDSSKKWDMVLLKTSLQGEQIWHKVIPNASSVKGAVINDSVVFISSTTDMFNDANTDNPVTYLLKINLDGDSLDSRIYDLGGESRTKDIISTVDGNSIILTGIRDGDSESRTHMLMKLNLNGDAIWSKTYLTEPETYYTKVHQTEDNGYIIIGFKSYKDDLKLTLRMFKVDSAGNMLWKDPNKDLDCSILDLVELKDGVWLATGYQYAEEHGFDGRVLKFDSDGKLLWNKSLCYEFSLYLTGLIPWVNGNYLIVGNLAIDNRFRFEKLRGWDTYFIASVTPDGEVIQSFNGKRAVFAPWGVIPISEGYCVMTGFGGKYKKGEKGAISNQDIGLLHYKGEK
ncbi:MAG: hypothetical protein P9X24_19635 [Candidatus Hatepunaea meridiana]|nr:hypothetical protein [Candidatus Hatepunaea meridiana]